MAASPEIAEPPDSSDAHSSPHPPSPGLHPTQESPSLTTAAPREMANPNHATSIPPPPAEQSTLDRSKAYQLPPTAIDEAEPPPSHPPPEEAPAASSAFEAIPAEKLPSPSLLPEDVAAEISPEVAASVPSPSPPPSPQIVGFSPEDAPQPPSPPRTPPATTAHVSTDSSPTEAIAMESQEQAARSSPALESMDADSRTAPAPLTPPMESGPEELLRQQQPRPPSPEMGLLLCENLEPTQPPPPQPCHPAECTDASPNAMVGEVVEGTSGKAAESLPVAEATDGDTDITPGVLPALKIGSEELLSQQQPPPPCSEMAPQRGENSKFAQPPPLAESTYVWSNATPDEVSAVASEETTAVLEFGAQRSLQESVQSPMTSRMEAEPCSPEMAPPGFEDFKSQWLPLLPPTPQAESTHNVVQVAATNPVGMTPDAATGSLSALEATGVEMDISPGLLPPPLKSGAECRSQQPLLGSCSPMTETAPCSPDMPPPGFENCKSSWLPPPTIPPLAEITHALPLPDVASTNTVAFVDNACSVPALEATDVETDAEWCRLPPLESGTGSSLQGPPPRLPSRTMQAAPSSPDTTPPGFKNIKAMHVTSNEVPQSSSALEAMDLDMDATPAMAPPLVMASEEGKPSPPEFPFAPSHVGQHTACSLGMIPSGSKNVESSQPPPPPPPAVVLPLDETPDALVDAGTKAVTMEEMCHPLPVTGAKEEANVSTLLPARENGCEGQLPHLEPNASSAAVHVAPTSPEIAPRSFENSESSQKTSLCLAETINPSAHASATMPTIVKSDKTSDMDNATLQQSPLKSEERPLPQPEQYPSSPSVKDTTCSPEVAPPGYENLDSSEQLPLPPPLSVKFEMGQMVCGFCRQLLAYPKGAVHVQCFGCWTINLVLEEHQVGKVCCGQCDTLLMYPFGAPAVKCSNCLFVTEIGERNVRPRVSMEQSVSPHPQEVAHQS